MTAFFRRGLRLLILALFLFSIPVSAFVFGTEEDLAALSPAANHPPIAQNISLDTYQNVAFTGRFSATDPEGDFITFRITKKPARGSVAISEGAQFIYTPYENKTGKDSFAYIAEDASGNTSTPATVKLKIQKPNTKVTYADMNGHPAHSAAIRMAEKNILTGERLGTVYFFHPELLVTREAFLAMAMDAMGLETLRDVTVTGFADDDLIAAWAKPYIASALKCGMVQGVGNERGQAVFRPNAVISQAEATVLLNRLLRVSNVTTVVDEDSPVWAAQSVRNLEAVGVLSASNHLEPSLTRGDAVLMLSAALDVLTFRADTQFPF